MGLGLPIVRGQSPEVARELPGAEQLHGWRTSALIATSRGRLLSPQQAKDGRGLAGSLTTRGTGTAVACSAASTRYSRSTACAEGSTLPGGFLRSTYAAPPAACRHEHTKAGGVGGPGLTCVVLLKDGPSRGSSCM